MSFTRIGANIAAMQSMNALMKVNRLIGQGLLRLSSGKRINSVGDDAAGFSLARGLESRRRSLEQAMSNVGGAKNVLSIAEGGYLAVAGILQIIKEKAVQGADDSFSDSQRLAIQGQIDAMVLEINDIVNETIFQGALLIDGSFTDKLFQTGAGAGDTFAVELGKASAAAFTGFATDSQFIIRAGENNKLVFNEGGGDLTATIDLTAYNATGRTGTDLAAALKTAMDAAGADTYTVTYTDSTGLFSIASDGVTLNLQWTDIVSNIGRVLGYNVSTPDTGATTYGSDFAADTLSVASSASAAAAMENVDAAIDTLNSGAQTVGEFMIRLSSKEDNLAVAVTNTEAARSRIEDADFAKEQMDLVRAQIVQQTAFSSFAQANSAPQLILSLFR
ncbi:MAG: flagellin [Candidatus Marinimicrobia bacterium]|nr:flagellin [Candidatus Neomarinimicrobiota bacterium]